MHICLPNPKTTKNTFSNYRITTWDKCIRHLWRSFWMFCFSFFFDLAGICAWSIQIMLGFVSFLGFPQCLQFSHAVSYAGASAEFGQVVVQPFSQPVTGLTVCLHSQTEAERETETDTETDARQADRQADRQAGRQADRQGGREIDR